MSVLNVTSENYESEVLKSEKTVLIDFYADWCGPCKMMSPVIDEIAEEMKENVKVGKVNVDDEELIASAFSIESIPTMMIFKAGKLVAKTVGYQPENILKKWIEDNK